MWEVFTYGGGEFLVEIFNAVAALTNGANYLSLIKISLYIGLIWVLLIASFEMKYAYGAKWFIAFILIYNSLFLPKTTIHITDRLNPSVQAATISNVPFGLAFFASISSQIGDSITRIMEQNFSLPDDLKYQQHGMLFGVELLRTMQNVKISNSIFASNLSSYMGQCVFYDLLLGKYNLNELKNSSNIWHFLTVENQPSPARSVLYKDLVNPKNSEIITCLEASVRFNNLWNNELNNTISLLGKKLFGASPSVINNNQIIALLPVTANYFMDISSNSLDILKQQIMINSFNNTALDFTAKNLTDSYTAARAELQARSSYESISRQAAKWVPTLKIVFECLYYGAFPIVFLFMLLPTYVTTLKSYFFAFIWLQSFAPLYAILNLITSGIAKTNNLSASLLPNGEHALTLFTHSGINEVNHDVAVLAGYLSLSIPFIALGLAKGTLNVGELATSILSISQKAATDAAEEVTTGNISLGNSSIANYNLNNINQNRIVSSSLIDDHSFGFRNEQGGFTYSYGKNNLAYDQGQAISNLPMFNIKFSDNISKNLQKNIEGKKEQSAEYIKSRQKLLSNGYAQIISQAYNQNANNNSTNDYSSKSGFENNQSQHDIKNYVNALSHSNNISTTDAINLAAEMAAKAAIGGDAGVLSANIGGNLSGNLSRNIAKNTSESSSESIQDSKNLNKILSELKDLLKNNNYHLSNNKGEDISDSVRAQLNEADNYEKRYSNNEREISSLTQSKNQIDSQALSIDRQLNHEFVTDFLPKQDDYSHSLNNGEFRKLGNDGALRIVSSNTPEDRLMLSKYLNEFKANKIMSDFSSHEFKSMYNAVNPGLDDGVIRGDLTADFEKRGEEIRERFDADGGDEVDNSGLVDVYNKRKYRKKIINQ